MGCTIVVRNSLVFGNNCPQKSRDAQRDEADGSLRRERLGREEQTWPGFPDGTSGKDPPVNAGDIRDAGSIPGSGRSPGGGSGNPFQYSYLENPRYREA